MSSTIQILVFTGDDKVPGFYPEVKFGMGRISIGALPKKLVCTGNPGTAAIAVEGDIVPIYGEDDADTYADAGYEGYMQLVAALQYEGVTLFYAPVAEAAGAVAAYARAVWGGTTAASSGQVIFYLNGHALTVSITAGDTPAIVAATMEDVFGADSPSPVTPSVVSTSHTKLPVNSAGVRGKD